MTEARLAEVDLILDSGADHAAVQLELERELRSGIGNEPLLLRLARCQMRSGQWPQAVATYELSASLTGGATSRAELGLVLSAGGNYLGAVDQHKNALARDPKNLAARFGLAQATHQLCLIDEALELYDGLLADYPTMVEALGFKLVAQNYRVESQEELLPHYWRYSALVGEPVNVVKTKGGMTRVGFFSPDLRQHSCAYFLERLFRHTPHVVEVVLFHDSHIHDEMTDRLVALSGGRLVKTLGMSNQALEQAALEIGLDIAVDLAGHFSRHRLQVFARRVGRRQISYLGYPNTTGVTAMDARLADPVADGPARCRYHPHFIEPLTYLSHSMWCYAPPKALPTPVPKEPVFGYFGLLSKISPTVLRTWSRLLALTRAKLLVKGTALDDPATRQLWLDRFAQAGISADRLELVGRTATLQEHLAMYGRVTVALDTWPYNGTTTTCEALWMGVPVVAMIGSRHASRVSHSLLLGAGLTSSVADTNDYINIALRLIENPYRVKRSDVKSASWMSDAVAKEFWNKILS